MKRNYNVIEKACGWPDIYQQIVNKYDKTTAEQLFNRAEQLLKEYSEKYRDCKGIKKVHVSAAIASGALYLPLKGLVGTDKAVAMMREAVKPTSIAKHDRIEKMPSALYMKVAYLITSTMFSEKAGFQRKWHANTSTEKSFDLLTCPYVEVLRTMGCPEVCPAICIQDDYSFSNMKNGVVFERKKTLGRGDECCDFCFRAPLKK